MNLDEFIRLSLRGAAPEGLLRFNRRTVARLPELSRPLALRWEALRKAGRVTEARQMRELCIRHFPERASVWATAGNQALDEGQLNRAQRYFDECLGLAPDWTPGLVGKAIVLERRKQFRRALEYRKRVVELESAMERRDPPSLQRVVRYAAALARLGRWSEACVLFRRAVQLDAFALLPAERPVLVRVFSREQYSPASIAALYAQQADALDTSVPEIALALGEAHTLGRVYESLRARDDLAKGQRLKLLGMCAWVAGDYPRAYGLLDEAEVHAPDDPGLQHLLACSAAALGTDDLPSIVRFAIGAARKTIAEALADQPTGGEQVLYALATLERFAAPHEARTALGTLHARADDGFIAFYIDPVSEPQGREGARLLIPPGTELTEGLRRLTAFRTARIATGSSTLQAAWASNAALMSLDEDPSSSSNAR